MRKVIWKSENENVRVVYAPFDSGNKYKIERMCEVTDTEYNDTVKYFGEWISFCTVSKAIKYAKGLPDTLHKIYW